MIHGFEAYSNLSKSLDKILEAHWESGLEAHSKTGFLVKDSMENALESKKTNYTIKTVEGKRIIVKEKSSHSMGERFDKDSGKKLSATMGNFIQWRTYSTTGTTVVGGLMKPGQTEVRKEGRVTGTTKVYGVRQQSVDILEKIDSGKTGKAEWVHPLGKESMPEFSGTHRATNFIREGKSNALSGIDGKLSTWLASAIKRRESFTKQNMEKKI